MRISDWSSDVCSSDLFGEGHAGDYGIAVGCGITAKLAPDRAERAANPLPIPRHEKLLVQLGFGRAGSRLPVVLPRRERRHRHKDRFGAAACLETEMRPALPDQTDYDITPSTRHLQVAFPVARRH